jgi:hypothetical protein
MNLRVTIDAAANEEIRAGISSREPLGRIDYGWMARTLVTCLAQKRRPQLQQRRLRRAVRVVTVSAVLGDRLMFPEKRPAIFGVAGRASFIDGIFHQLRPGRRAVRRVARGAGHRAFAQGMMRRLQKIAVLRLVTRAAHFDLSRCYLHRIFGHVQLVAACAGHVARGMRARCPVMRCVRLMAAQTLGILRGCGTMRFGTVDDDFGYIAPLIDMRRAGSVAGFALQSAMPKRAARIIWTSMLGVKDAHHGGIIAVASETGIGSLRAVR